MTTDSFDPSGRLPGPPDPWAYASAPSWRDGPPYHLTDMIAAEPGVARRIIERLTDDSSVARLADLVRSAITSGAPVVITGCGTSETAAMGMVDILRDATRSSGHPDAVVLSEQAFELAQDPLARGLVIGVSHEGGTSATNAALKASRAAGSQTAVVTVSRRSPAGQFADVVLETCELDQSWCHSVGYVSPMVTAAVAGARLTGTALDGDAVAGLLEGGARDADGATRIGERFGSAEHLLVIASGADRAAGREMALKVEEASWLPSAYRDLETFLHGHLPATGPETALVLILSDRIARPERVARARQALAAAKVIGLRSAAILAEALDGEVDRELTPAGRVLVPDDDGLPAPVASLMGTASALQLLTERIARARGRNPDLIRREDDVYRRAAEAAGG
jgi:glucosamine--fructose-6-phosphate aminotransferase (isomerizing)